jgi:pyruvate/2-oxoglutarate dehydrogenase complex dihydrolipoamide dehydrogenase (E3) component
LASSGPAFKDDWKRFLAYLLRELEKWDVEVKVGTEATAQLVRAENADELILAVGAEPVLPDVPGIVGPNVVLVGDVLSGRPVPGTRVVVVGDGGMGQEAALYLARQGKQVAIIEIPGGSAQDQTVNFVDVMVLEDQLEELGIRVRKGVVLEQVLDGKVVVRDGNGQTQELPADAVVVAANLRARADVVEKLMDSAPEVHVVGDCKAPRILFNAVHEGFEAALEI